MLYFSLEKAQRLGMIAAMEAACDWADKDRQRLRKILKGLRS